jgi:hypothetical protein
MFKYVSRPAIQNEHMDHSVKKMQGYGSISMHRQLVEALHTHATRLSNQFLGKLSENFKYCSFRNLYNRFGKV